MSYSVGDWVFHNFELGQVQEVNRFGQPVGVLHKYGPVGCEELSVAPLTMENMVVSETFLCAQRRLSNDGMLTPCVFRHLLTWWADVVEGRRPFEPDDVDRFMRPSWRN